MDIRKYYVPLQTEITFQPTKNNYNDEKINY